MSSGKRARPLRKGWTTGTCAAAAAAAAYQAFLTGDFPDPVQVSLPRGGTVSLPLSRRELVAGRAAAGVIKDAGDDPDVTHGAEIIATVRQGVAGQGIFLRAGDGVGTVTLAGLAVPVGQPAINPGPRAMICNAIAVLAARFAADCDVEITIAVPGGAALAERTLNRRLGIEGGISILGTTGIVVPYSCAAWIHSIHRGIDVAREAGLDHLAAATGRTSERAVRHLYGLPELALIDMGDFVGGTLKYLRAHPVARLSIAGGAGKLAKLGQGSRYLHSSRSRVDFPRLAEMLGRMGAPEELVDLARSATTVRQVVGLARACGVPLADRIAAEAKKTAAALLTGATAIEVLVFDAEGRIAGRAPFDG
jgi:cobalt-precorrin-5B (C1)-methyltransferase